MANIVEFLRTDKVTEWIKSKFSNENKIARFKSNIVAISNSNELLQKADPKTIMTACYQGVLLNLPMEKQFVYAYVVPYNTKITRIINGREVQEWVNQAQFQMGYKGYIQLAQISGQYLDIAASDVRDGELINYDRLKGTSFNWIQNEDEREKLPIIVMYLILKWLMVLKKHCIWQKSEWKIILWNILKLMLKINHFILLLLMKWHLKQY